MHSLISIAVMRKDIHPQYYPNAKITCSCGNSFTVGSTMPSYEVEICSACHPFYTGKGRVVDTAGRVERFQKRLAQQKSAKTTKKVRIRKPRIEKVIMSSEILAAEAAKRSEALRRMPRPEKLVVKKLPPARGRRNA